MRGAGTGIGSRSDEFQFVYRTISGDTDISVRLDDLQSFTGQAGVMIRESLGADAANATIVFRGSQDVAFLARSRAGRGTSVTAGAATVTPTWLRLVRQGRTFRAYTSPTGETWTLLDSANVNMKAQVLVGVAVSSQDPAQFASASFSSSAFGESAGAPSDPIADQPADPGTGDPTAPALPAPWAAGDIGGPAIAGTAAAANGVFTVSGSGNDIWDAADQFHYMYQPVTGDTQIVARVASLQATNAWSKGGLMIRSGLTGPSAHVSLFATGDRGWSFQRRLQDGGLSVSTLTAGAAPGWVRLVREGSLFSAYHSSDGTTWKLLGTDTVQMPSAVYAGLAVTSQDVTATTTATYDNVAVSTPTSSNTPPTVSLTSPANGATFTAPASISVSAAAGDSDGLISRVQFFANGALIGTATAQPFTINWASVPAGSYTLTAVATDNGGDSTTSAPVAVTVSAAATATPTSVSFTPPTDYSTNVTSTTVELRRSTDAVTAAAIASGSLGKPAAVNGQVTVDISALVNPLPAGSYYAVVVAIGPGGSTKSSPSAAFTK